MSTHNVMLSPKQPGSPPFVNFLEIAINMCWQRQRRRKGEVVGWGRHFTYPTPNLPYRLELAKEEVPPAPSRRPPLPLPRGAWAWAWA